MSKKAAIEHLRKALEMADSDNDPSYRVGAMEQRVKFALAELGVDVDAANEKSGSAQ